MRIIANKKLDITESEYSMYKKLCMEYTTQFNKGEDMFIDHFEVNDYGIITLVNPPTKKRSSVEIFCFLISLMTNQHLRNAQKQVDAMVSDLKNITINRLKELDSKMVQIENNLNSKVE